METAKKLNPAITVVDYGKREIKSITIYPLSVGDQLKVTEIIAQVISDVVDRESAGGKMSNFAYMNLAISAIKDNIAKLIPLISDLKTEEVDGFLDDLTNDQLLDIADVVWKTSYEPSIKKGQDLFARMRNLFPSKRSPQASSSGIQATPLTESSDEVGKTED